MGNHNRESEAIRQALAVPFNEKGQTTVLCRYLNLMTNKYKAYRKFDDVLTMSITLVIFRVLLFYLRNIPSYFARIT